MTKRGSQIGSDRIPAARKDLVDTPKSCAEILSAALPPTLQFSEPCAGARVLADHLESLGHDCVEAYDLAPRDPRVDRGDACTRIPRRLAITNPPYSRNSAIPILKAAISWPHGAWLLVPHDWLANRWFAPFARHVGRLLPVGRVSWLGNGQSGFENSSWIWLQHRPVGFVLPRPPHHPSRGEGFDSRAATEHERNTAGWRVADDTAPIRPSFESQAHMMRGDERKRNWI